MLVLAISNDKIACKMVNMCLKVENFNKSFISDGYWYQQIFVILFWLSEYQLEFCISVTLHCLQKYLSEVTFIVSNF